MKARSSHCSLLRVALLSLSIGSLSPAPAALAGEPQFLGRNQYQWIQSLEASTSRRQRAYSAWALAEFSVEQANSPDTMKWLNELFLMTENDNPSVRYWGVWGVRRFVAKLGDTHPARGPALKLLAELTEKNSPSVEIAAAEALAHLGRPQQGLPVLTRALEDPQESVRIQAAAALESLGELARPAEGALQRAKGDSSEYVKRLSTRALETLANRAAK
jgi:HEAT repeat protein